MRKLDVSLESPEEVGVRESDLKKVGAVFIFGSLFTAGVNSLHQGQIPNRVLWVLAPIQRKLSKSKIEDTSIKLEEAEFNLVKEVFTNENTTFIIGDAQLVSLYKERIEKAEKIDE